jgi:hypothetical protein
MWSGAAGIIYLRARNKLRPDKMVWRRGAISQRKMTMVGRMEGEQGVYLCFNMSVWSKAAV